MSDKTLIQAIDEALENIKKQTPEEYFANIQENSDGPLSQMFTMKCNCGKETKYMHRTDDGDVMSCNKHVVCEPYDVIEDELRQVNMKYHSLIKLAKDLMLYREGTIEYNIAHNHINILIAEYEGK